MGVCGHLSLGEGVQHSVVEGSSPWEDKGGGGRRGTGRSEDDTAGAHLHH